MVYCTVCPCLVIALLLLLGTIGCLSFLFVCALLLLVAVLVYHVVEMLMSCRLEPKRVVTSTTLVTE